MRYNVITMGLIGLHAGLEGRSYKWAIKPKGANKPKKTKGANKSKGLRKLKRDTKAGNKVEEDIEGPPIELRDLERLSTDGTTLTLGEKPEKFVQLTRPFPGPPADNVQDVEGLIPEEEAAEPPVEEPLETVNEEKVPIQVDAEQELPVAQDTLQTSETEDSQDAAQVEAEAEVVPEAPETAEIDPQEELIQNLPGAETGEQQGDVEAVEEAAEAEAEEVEAEAVKNKKRPGSKKDKGKPHHKHQKGGDKRPLIVKVTVIEKERGKKPTVRLG